MVPRSAAGSGPRGGSRIPSLRAPRARLIAGGLALALGVGIASYSLTPNPGQLALIVGPLALAAVLVSVVSLVFAWAQGIGWTLAGLASLHVIHLYISGTASAGEIALVGVGLLLVGELSQWSLDSRFSGSYETSLHTSRAVGLTLLVSLALGVALLAQLVSGIPLAGSLATVVAGTSAAVGLLVLIAIVGLRGAGSR